MKGYAEARRDERKIDRKQIFALYTRCQTLEVVENKDEYFIGTDESGLGATIYWDEVHSIELTKIDVGKFVLVTPVVIAGAAIAIAVLALAAAVSIGAQ